MLEEHEAVYSAGEDALEIPERGESISTPSPSKPTTPSAYCVVHTGPCFSYAKNAALIIRDRWRCNAEKYDPADPLEEKKIERSLFGVTEGVDIDTTVG